jgi:CheY-like chemotaxis protein
LAGADKDGDMTKILIAEDERDIRELVSFSLQFGGFTVVQAANGAEAVEQAQKELPDLILMDVRMPKMTGYEACRQMKLLPELRDVPVVFLSAKGQESEIQTGLEVGAEEYILKPFAPDDLVKQVQAVLDRVAARRAGQAQ